MWGKHWREGYSWQVVQDHENGCFVGIVTSPTGAECKFNRPSYSQAEDAAIAQFNRWLAHGIGMY